MNSPQASLQDVGSSEIALASGRTSLCWAARCWLALSVLVVLHMMSDPLPLAYFLAAVFFGGDIDTGDVLLVLLVTVGPVLLAGCGCVFAVAAARGRKRARVWAAGLGGALIVLRVAATVPVAVIEFDTYFRQPSLASSASPPWELVFYGASCVGHIGLFAAATVLMFRSRASAFLSRPTTVSRSRNRAESNHPENRL
jgi:hypothetical protein